MNILTLFMAIVAIESNGNSQAIGDKGKAVGPAQIWEVTVRDANRIAHKSFTLADRTDLAKSKEIFEIITSHYGKRYGLPITDEVRARIWNGGPTGPSKQSTLGYWAKVKAKL